MSQPPHVSVLIVSWNGREHLAACLAALSRQRAPGVPWDVWVFDNGSRDGSVAWLRAEQPHVHVLESAHNTGFSAANNRLAEACTGDWLALLNNDTAPEPDWLAQLVAALRDAPDDVAAVAGSIVDWEGTRLDFGRGVMTFDGHAFQLDFGRPLATATLPAPGAELPFACGGNMLVRRAAFQALGGFDERYFAYLEDVDLGWRLWAAGQRVLAAPQARVRHRSSATSARLGNYQRGFLFERNAFLTAFKNYEAGLFERVMPAVLTTLLARTQTLLIENNAGGSALRLDPFAGLLADTAPGAPAPVVPARPRAPRARLRLPRFLARAGQSEAAQNMAALAADVALRDERSVAQFRVLSWLLAHLDESSAARHAVQARRQRSDEEFLERFPPYVVPTYPGDAALFASAGFRALLPARPAWQFRELHEVMAL